jgi:hypothetical protein
MHLDPDDAATKELVRRFLRDHPEDEVIDPHNPYQVVSAADVDPLSIVRKAQRKAARQKARSATAMLLWQLRGAGLRKSQYQREQKLCPPRRWSFDLSFKEIGVAVEIHGIIPHTSIGQFISDCEKASSAFALGWTVVPVLHKMIESGEAFEKIVSGIKARAPNFLTSNVTPDVPGTE